MELCAQVFSLKFPLLPIILAVSLLVNAAGIVFLCLFISSEAHVKSLKHDKRVLTNNLTAVSLNSDTSEPEATDQFIRRSFISHHSHQQDIFALAPPTINGPRENMTLLVYLHGMGSSYLEPFLHPTDSPLGPQLLARENNLLLLSSNYGKVASWGNDEGYSDLTQNIREVCDQYPIGDIIIMGTSMGGCVALSYPTRAPDDIKSKICGIVSVEGAGSLDQLYDRTKSQAVKTALAAAFGGPPAAALAKFQAVSLIPNINKLPSHVKVVIVSASKDQIVPPEMQQELVEILNKAHIPTKMIVLDIPHQIPAASVYDQAYDLVKK